MHSTKPWHLYAVGVDYFRLRSILVSTQQSRFRFEQSALQTEHPAASLRFFHRHYNLEAPLINLVLTARKSTRQEF